MKKVWIVMLVVASVLLVGCGSNSSSESSQSEVNTYNSSKEVDELSVGERKDLEQETLEYMQTGLGETFEISLNEEEKEFYFLPNNQPFIDEVDRIIAGDLPTDEWDQLVSNFVSYNNAIATDGLVDYSFHILNPYNPDRTMVLIYKGELLYDGVNEAIQRGYSGN